MTSKENKSSEVPIYRYIDTENSEFRPASGDSEIELITEHIEKHFGKIESVFHEIVSEFVHLDIHHILPNDTFPFHILVTSGMSDKPMNVPVGQNEDRFAELCILLPKDWPIETEKYKLLDDVFKDENSFWPIRWLKLIARFPHEFDTWIGWGHTIPNGEAADPFSDNTKLGCMLIMPGISLPLSFFDLKVSGEKTIKFFCLYPLYKEEMNYRLQKGTDKLLEKFDKYKISDVININRQNTCLKTGLFGLWK